MEIKEITNEDIWDQFILKLNLNTFLHSKGWIRFNQKQSYKTWRLGLFDKDKLVAVALIIKVSAKRGTFLFCPHGPQSLTPVDSEHQSTVQSKLQAFTDYLKQLAKTENCNFIRIQPIVAKTPDNAKIFEQVGFRAAPIHMHTELSTVLNLDRPIDEILLGMRKTTRQMVKKGMELIKNQEVKIEYFKEITDDIYEVYKATGVRGNFIYFSREYLQKELESFQESGNVVLYTVKYHGQILSWGMVIFSGDRAFYHQGANLLHKQIPVSYICQWTGIQQAIQRGCKTYDFWGVAPVNATNHPWARISLFKRGFGGQDTELLHAQDLAVSWKYWFTWVIETFRARKRGFA